jgi:hypothetical protein
MKNELRLLAILGWLGIVAAGCHGADTLTPQSNRCGATPRLLVSAASYWQGDAGAGTASVGRMALDGSDLYFIVELDSTPPAAALPPGALMHVSTQGGPVTQLADGYEFQQLFVTPTSIIVGVLDGSSLLGGILSVPRAGGAATPIAWFNDDFFFTPPVTDGTSFYFVDNAGVRSVPLAAGAALASVTQVATGQPDGLAVFAQRLLLLYRGSIIQEVPIGPSGPGAEAVLGGGPVGDLQGSLIHCGANACWLTDDSMGDDAVQQMDPTSGATSTRVSVSGGTAYPDFFAFDGTNFFVLAVSGSSPSSATIERIPPQGGAPVTVANLPPSYYNTGGFAVDDACVYFTTAAGIYSLSSSAEGVSVQ